MAQDGLCLWTKGGLGKEVMLREVKEEPELGAKPQGT